MLTGAWARGDAHPESPIELLLILERIGDRWQEKRRMDRIVWRYSIRHDTVLPVTEAELEQQATPMLARASAEAMLLK
jgi:predicted nucleotidyltransferase